ncbi:MAG: hypothetical protein J5J06_06485 [Phycisphaerae bacterium]|nr:hypothetical protein [Phycisphaerae bacterium]
MRLKSVLGLHPLFVMMVSIAPLMLPHPGLAAAGAEKPRPTGTERPEATPGPLSASLIDEKARMIVGADTEPPDSNALGLPNECTTSPDRTTCVGTCEAAGIDECAPVEILVTPEGQFIEITCCECAPPACRLEYTQALGMRCVGTCPSPPGGECSLVGEGNPDGTISYHCECADPTAPHACEFVSQCNPRCPGQCYERCTGNCQAPGEVCLPHIVTESANGIADFHVTECDCAPIGDDPCRPIIDATGHVACIGSTCAKQGVTCELIPTVNPDGTVDYSCCPGGDPRGACCADIPGVGLTCVETTQFDCLNNLGGTYFGDGSMCDDVQCPDPPPTGACCHEDATGNPVCTVTTADDCVHNLGGTYQGDGTPCTPDPCERGACCYRDPVDPSTTLCQVMTLGDCDALGGIFHGVGSSCTPWPCQVEGACCVPDCPAPTCALTSGFTECVQILGGIYQGDNTSCTPNPCSTPEGACCHVDALGVPTCTVTSQFCCTTQLMGTYQGDDSACDADLCPSTGACCTLVGGVYQCTEIPFEDCVPPSVYHGLGTTCNPDACCDKDTKIYAIKNGGELYEIDPDAATTTNVGSVPGGYAIAPGPTPNSLYVTTASGILTIFDVVSGLGSSVGPGALPLGISEGRDGWLYSIDFADLYRTNPGTGASTFIGSGANVYAGDIAANECGDLFGVPWGNLVRVDKISGAQTVVGFNGMVFWGLAFSLDGRLWAAEPYGQLFQLDPDTGAVIDSPMNLGFTPLDMASQPYKPCHECARPPLSLREWWALDETTVPPSTIPVAAGKDGLNGVHVGGPTPVAGAVNVALEFDGVDDHVRVPDHFKIDFGKGPFSIDAWIKTEAATGIQPIVDKRALAGGVPRGYWFYLINGELAFQLGDGAGATDYVRPGLIADGQWHHVAVTVKRTSATGLRLYVDGLAVAFDPTPHTGNISNNAELLIGASHPIPTASFYEGRIDEVQVFRRAIDAGEVQAIYTAGSAGKCREHCIVPSPVLFCKNQNSRNANIQICNYCPTPKTFNWSLSGPLSGSGCDALGTMTFTPSSGSVTVAGGCQSIPITVTRPIGMVPGDIGCYELNVVNAANGATFGCQGELKATNKWCLVVLEGVPIDIKKLPVGVSTPIGFEFANEEDADGHLDYEIQAVVGTVNQPQVAQVSLDGLPPGQPVTGAVDIPPGSSMADTVEVTLLEHEPFNFHRLLFRFDLDNDGTNDDALSIPMESEESALAPPLAAAGYPHGAPKNRYVSFVPNPASGGLQYAYEVKHVDTSQSHYISTPRSTPTTAAGEGLTFLVADQSPVLYEWTQLAQIHVGGCLIAPGENYEVRATPDGISYSTPLAVSTTAIPSNGRWWADVVGVFSAAGDAGTSPPTPPSAWTPPNGGVTGFDIAAALQAAVSGATAPHVTWTDINGQQPDRVTNGNDVLRVVNAFSLGSGREFYPFDVPNAPGPQGQDPCPAPPLESELAP